MKEIIPPPNMVSIDVHVKTHGKYKTKSGLPRGLVVHFTAGRSKNGKDDAVRTLNTLSFKGLGCFSMDAHGVIYRAQNQMIDDVAYHCGASAWMGYKGISQYCMGLEICNAGALKPYPDNFGKSDKFISWFGETYYQDEVRFIEKKTNNQWAGFYHKFSFEQENALWNFCKWQKEINPEFSYDWVIGHDECAVPNGRKYDPGGSLSCDMATFRNDLKNLA